jgi:CDP-6-deoxy-D-xylo-4-hexulose-3-dehydrase
MYWPLMKNTINWKDKYELIKFIVFSDRFTNGPKVCEFEQAWSRWLGSKYSLYVSSGSTANFLLVAAVKELYKIPNGSKVVVPACTWVTNVSPILQLGLEPVFSDISLDHFSFDTEKLPNDPTIKIVFVTHLLGLDAPIEKLKEFYPNAIFIEDICESHGVEDPLGMRRGSHSSLASTFSFYYGHHMTTIEGGMISTNNKELYELMRLKRSHGLAREMSASEFAKAVEKHPDIDSRFLFMSDGYNFRNTELGAVLGLSQLKRLDDSISIRRRNYIHFVKKLEQFSDHVYVPDPSPRNSSFVFPVVCKTPDLMKRIKNVLHSRGIENRPIVAGNLLRQPFLENFAKIALPNADILNDNGVYVGNNQFVTLDMVDALIDVISKEINEGHRESDYNPESVRQT